MEEMEFGPNGGLMYCFECVPPAPTSWTFVRGSSQDTR